MPDGARDAFASRFDRLVRASGLQAKMVVSHVNRSRKPEAPWRLTAGVVSAWRTGRNLPSGANEEGFFRAVRVLTEHARGQAVRGQDVGELLDESSWSRLLQRARADAEHGEIIAYLEALIRWLNTDPWPTDMRFGSPALSPATMELRRRVETSLPGERDCDADELADRLCRMVLGGEPGMGKTWFARRSARRCAETALSRLAAGDSLDDIELPLYTTCTRLVGMPQGDEIRHAVIRSALSHLPDLGGARISTAVQDIFQDRSAPTLLVLDSLDEAPGTDVRIRQAETLPSSWRVLLTTRPAAWNNQLAVPDGVPDRALAELQPLSYPGDVEAFVTTWFEQEPERAADLIAQLRCRPELRRSAEVPLMLAFYCILGTTEQLPARQGDLHTKVINRLLTGGWRDSRHSEPDLSACRATLRAWAWTAAERDRNPVSGTGGWADEFPTLPVRDEADREALSHVAPPTGPADPDRGTIPRHFIHRSIQEHLVAEHLALLPIPEAADELLSHLWWDGTWRISATAAVIHHPERDELLTRLIARLTGTGASVSDLADLDAGFQVRLFLAQMAKETAETDWSPEAARLIARARADVACSRWAEYFPLTTDGWPDGDLEARLAILAQLADMAGHSHERPIHELKSIVSGARALSQLKPSTAEIQRTRRMLMKQFIRHAPRPDILNQEYLTELAQAIAELGPTADERALIRNYLRTWIAVPNQISIDDDGARKALKAIEAAPGEAFEMFLAAIRELIASREYSKIPRVARNALALCRGKADHEALRSLLLSCASAALDLPTALQLADKVLSLEPSAADRAKMLDSIIAAYKHMAESNRIYITTARDSPQSILPKLAATPRERARLYKRLIELMVDSNHHVALELAETASALMDADAPRGRLLDAVLTYMPKVADYSNAVWFTALLKDADLSAHESAQILSALLGSFQGIPDNHLTLHYFEDILTFAKTDQERARARKVLLDRITPDLQPRAVERIVSVLAKIGATDDDRAYLRQMVEQHLGTEKNPLEIYGLMGIISHLAFGTEILARAETSCHQAALHWLANDEKAEFHEILMRVLKLADATGEQRTALRNVLLRRMAEATRLRAILSVVQLLVDLSRTEAERAEALEAMVKRLCTENDRMAAESIMRALCKLNPAANDLGDVRQWKFSPITSLLVAVRSNTPASDWIVLLRDIASI